MRRVEASLGLLLKLSRAQQGFTRLSAGREASETVWPGHIWSHVTPSPAWTTVSVESRVAFVGSQLSLPFYSHREGIA